MGIFRDVCPFFGEQQKLGRERHVEICFRSSAAPFLALSANTCKYETTRSVAYSTLAPV